MDAFKLLSRPSASLRKQTIGAQKPASSIPTSNAPVTQTMQTHSPNSSANIGSKKRKRRPETTPLDLPTELDFFGQNQAVAGRPVNVQADAEGAEGDAENSVVKDSLERVPLLPEDECRRILREHKLKITRLETREPVQEAIKSKKKRRKQQEADEEAKRKEKKQRKHNLDVVPQPLLDFAQLRLRHGVDSRLATNVLEQGYTRPTEVQLAALPLLLHSAAGSPPDLLTVAPTGSGKTLAFLIPVIDGVLRHEHEHEHDSRSDRSRSDPGPRAIILSPTKELAVQTVHEAKKLTKDTGLHVELARKSMSLGSDSNDAADTLPPDSREKASETEDDVARPRNKHKSADIIIATPLTLVNALINKDGTTRLLSNVQYLVLDEADVLLDPLFKKQTFQIWSACTNSSLRISLWSATMGASVEDLARDTIADRIKRSSSPTNTVPIRTSQAPLFRLIVGLKDSAIPHIAHRLTYCGNESGKLLALRQLLRPTSNASNTTTDPPLRPPFLVFTQTIARARALYSELLYDIPVSAGGSTRIAVLHADLTSRTRAEIMARVRKGEVWVLITTDLLSRGVDFRGVNGVVNYDFPSSSAAYVHRVGRTGRAGREGGVAVTLYDKDDMPFVKNVANVIAAANRAKGVSGSNVEGVDNVGDAAPPGFGLEKWLLESLPKPSKRDRQKLKKRGIESRRPDKIERGKAGKTRIGTKSGFERRAENNRKGAVEASKRRARSGGHGDLDSGDESGFEGFD